MDDLTRLIIILYLAVYLFWTAGVIWMIGLHFYHKIFHPIEYKRIHFEWDAKPRNYWFIATTVTVIIWLLY